MSLAVTVAPGSAARAGRVTLAVGGVMAALLLLAAYEQWQEGIAARHWLVPLCAAFACAGWCLVSVRRDRHGPGRQRWSLAIGPDGQVRLVDLLTGESVDAEVAMAWGLGDLIYLRLGAISKVVRMPPGADAGQSLAAVGAGPVRRAAAAAAAVSGRHAADCRWLLARRDFSEADWHGLRRWLVWYRRSGQAGLA